MREFPFDIFISQGTTYKTKHNQILVIQKVGTDNGDKSNPTILYIKNTPTGPFVSDFAPLHKTESNLLGPFDLGKLFYVVPPETEFYISAPSGTKVRLMGKYIELSIGEGVPADLKSRFEVQHMHYWTYEYVKHDHGTNVSIAAGERVELGKIETDSVTEKTLNSYLMAKLSNYTLAEGELALLMYLDNVPLYDLLTDNLTGGIDYYSLRYPPDTSTEMLPFSLEKNPIHMRPDQTLSLSVRNIKGSAITPATDTSLIFEILAVIEYRRR